VWLKVLARSDLAWVFDLLFSESQETLANSSHHIWEEKIIWKSQTLPKRKDTIKVGMKIENARLWTRFSLAEDGIKRGTSMKSVTRVRFQLKRGLLCLWFRASLICINNCQKRCNTKQSIYYSASSLYMFRVSTTPISGITQNCNYSLRVLVIIFVQLPPSNVAETCRVILQNNK